MYAMIEYRVTETDITPTGVVLHYYVHTREQAIMSMLYTAKLHNGNAHVTDRGVVHNGSLCYAPHKED